MKKVFWLVLPAAAVIAVVGLGAHLCRSTGVGGGHGGRSRFDDGPQYPQYNAILVSIDTLRADHLGCYGYFRDTSLNIDALSERSFVFRNTYVTSS